MTENGRPPPEQPWKSWYFAGLVTKGSNFFVLPTLLAGNGNDDDDDDVCVVMRSGGVDLSKPKPKPLRKETTPIDEASK
jgi:hypothetical protein